jgi:UDP-2-acetamido-3-amino-2,3-dideoxy-glucuronate N-acetyltransferase
LAFTAHPTAIVDEGAIVGDGSHVWHWTHISGGARIGRGCSIGQNVFIANNVVIGNNCKIQNNVSVYDNVTLQDDVFCGPSMVFTNVLNPRSHVPRKHEYRDTLVKRGATLGANCTIICGVTLGTYAFVGAGAVVTKDVPDHALLVGNPARLAGWMCACGVKLASGTQPPLHAACPACSTRYESDGRQLRMVTP